MYHCRSARLTVSQQQLLGPREDVQTSASDDQFVPQNLRSQVFKPRQVCRSHVELKNIIAHLVRCPHEDLNLNGLTRRNITGRRFCSPFETSSGVIIYRESTTAK